MMTDTIFILDDSLQLSDLPPCLVHDLFGKLGSFLRTEVVSNLKYLKTKCQDVESLLNFDYKREMDQMSPSLLAFLTGIMGTSSGTSTANYKLFKTVESVLNLSSFRCILPLHVREDIVLYSVGGSALSLQLLSHGSPHASYQTIRDIFKRLGLVSNGGLTGDYIAVFDNNQTLKRRWNIQVKHTAYVNVVTVVAFFKVESDGSVLIKHEYKPGIWFLKTLQHCEKERVKYLDKNDDVRRTHYTEHLQPYLDKMISKVAEEQEAFETVHGNIYNDHVDFAVREFENQRLYKNCCNCGETQIDKRKINCPVCNINLRQSRQEFLSHEADDKKTAARNEKTGVTYKINILNSNGSSAPSVSFQEIENVDNKVQVNECSVQEPIFVNPCSYESVCKILTQIDQKVGIPKYNNGAGVKQLIPVFCDGSPYNLCFRCICCTFRCHICQTVLCGLEIMKGHVRLQHKIQQNFDEAFSFEYDWVVLQPGGEHIEMNMVRGIFDLCWDIFLKDLAEFMHFKSEKAMYCLKKVTDHHKGWQILRIARDALTMELILPFVREQLASDNPTLTARAFCQFLHTAIKDPVYSLIADISLEFIDSIFLFQNGVRMANFSHMFSGLAKFAKLWSGRNHRNYRELEMSFTLTLQRMPEELRKFVEKSWSLNTSGVPGSNECPDFKLEAINLQHWLPSVPSATDWMQCCSQYDILQKFRESVFSQMGIHDPKVKSTRQERDLSMETNAFRMLLRKNKYLSAPREERELVSLSGELLDKELVHLACLCREKRAKYFEAYMNYESERSIVRTTIPFREAPVFVTVSERAKQEQLCNKTKAVLETEISAKIEKIPDENARHAFQDAWNCEVLNRGRTKKSDYIAFYEELVEYAENAEDYIDGNET